MVLSCTRTLFVCLPLVFSPAEVVALGKGEARFIQLMATGERIAELRNARRYLEIGRHVCADSKAATAAKQLAADLAQLDKTASVIHVAIAQEREVIQENMAAYGIAGKKHFHRLKTARMAYRVTVLQKVNGEPVEVSGTQIWLFRYRKSRWCYQPF